MKTCVVVLTRNPGRLWKEWIAKIIVQSIEIECLILDTESSDGTCFGELPSNFNVINIKENEFNHGATRNLALNYLPAGTEVVVFLTQDAFLYNSESLYLLLLSFNDSNVSCAWGKQLPHDNATPLAAHARSFNYPDTSRTVSIVDLPQLGLKTCFLSNSFAAYRLYDLLAVGGFPPDVILGEDMSVAARLLMTGKRVAYVAEALVQHSHNYTITEEFRRYFDTGVFHARSKWMLKAFGEAGGEGLRFVRSELKFLWRYAPGWIPAALGRTLAKWLGYKLGRKESNLPLAFKRWCTMHKGYWG